MKLDDRLLRELADLEKRIIEAAKSAFEGDWGHWTVLDTVNHACAWKNNALKKVESRLRGGEARYHSDKSLEEVNRHYYEKAKGCSRRDAIGIIEDTLARECAVLEAIEGRESSDDLAPTGYEGSVSDYLTFDLILHPVNHYAYYAIRNDEYEVFLEAERYVSKYRSSIFKDLGSLDIKGLAGEEELKRMLDKGYEWQNDDLFVLVRSMAVRG
jgi:hypothetical protein